MVERILAAVAMGALLAGAAPLPALVPAAQAQNLRVLGEGPAETLSVPVDRAVVVESGEPFAEVSIANPAIADISTLSDRTLYVLGRAPGRTSMTLLDGAGRPIANVEVRVAPDLSEFKERLGQILPGEPIEARSAAGGIVLSGQVSSIAKLDRALELAELYAPEQVKNLMVVGGTQQVMLKVRFAEMQRSVRKGLGVGIIGRARGDGDGVSVGLGRGRLDGDATSPGVPGSAVLDVVPEVSGAVGVIVGSSSAALGLIIDALEARGAVRTLAEPNLSALSGQKAEFLAGGEYPVPVAQEEGVVTIEFKPFGIELDFVPRVVDDGVINLELAAAVSSIDPSSGVTQNGFAVDAFRRRETSTTVEMRDGESFAIAGLLSDDFQDSVNQVPFLGDIPVLGALFRSSSYQRDQTELVVIVTAHLVSPVRGDALILPTDRVRPPSERELFLYGRTEGSLAGGAAEVARQDFQGSYGYVMD